MSVMIGRCVAGLLCMMIISVSSGTVYVQSGSDITDCNMKCPEDEDTVELYRQCRGVERKLLENLCFINTTKSHDPRLRLHTGSGCWKLTHVRKDDSCVYEVFCHCARGHRRSSTEIRVLDPVLISNITSTRGQLGEDTAVSVQFSGEESAVTWEVDGEPLPERYRLIDDNRTLIIPSVQRDDADRRFRVRITNPVSEEIQEYRLINDTMFISMLETEDSESPRKWYHRVGVSAGGVVVVIALFVAFIIYPIRSKRRKNRKVITETIPLNDLEHGAVPAMKNGAVPAMGNGAVPTMENGPMPTMGYGAVPNMESRNLPTVGNGALPI